MSPSLLKSVWLVAGVLCVVLGVPAGIQAHADSEGHTKPGIAIHNGVKWCLRVPPGEQIAYRGKADFDGAGVGSPSFLYPAPDAGSFLAGVITHAFIVDSQKKNQKDKFQASADKVLSPYRAVIDSFSYRELMRRSLAKSANGANANLIEGAELGCQDILVESTPVFSMTQDQMAIILDNVIVMHTPGTPEADAFRSVTRIVSVAREVSDPLAYWTANDGEKMKEESAELIANSLDVAFRDGVAGAELDGIAYRTIRYREGSAEKMERAQVLRDQCGRLLIRNLRGTLMSVPVSQPPMLSTTDQCGSGATRMN